jgi:flagellar biosynthesis protein FlhF
MLDIQTFRASTLQEALQLVRESLGPDAAVLHTRELRQSRLGLFPKRFVEVDASRVVAAANRLEQPNPGLIARSNRTQDSQRKPRTADTEANTEANPLNRLDLTNDTTARPPTLASQITAGPHPALTPAMFEVLTIALEAGVEPQLAKALLTAACEPCDLSQLHQSELIKARMIQLVANDLRTTGPVELQEDEQKVVALVGPTGVGKTTTLAKIAAGFRFDYGCQIGLITLDTFRLGAVDQLLQYAELISAPLEVVSSPEQVIGALQRLRECDLVFLDTAGRSPKDTEQLALLNDFLTAAEPDAVYLTVSATSSPSHVRETIQQFSALNPTSLLVTKLDEAAAFGEWLPVLQGTRLPISYVTAGQHVPEDIFIATPRRLANTLLGHAAQARGDSFVSKVR